MGKGGKFRPIAMLVAVPMAIVMMLSFWAPEGLSGTVLMIYIVTLAVLWAVFCTFGNSINMVANVCRIFVSKPFGRYSDKKSFAKGFELALYLAAIAFFANIFTTQKHWYFIIIYTVFYNVCLAGINQNNYNISYSYAAFRVCLRLPEMRHFPL